MGNPWDRLPEESNLWWQRFERFRLVGPGRSINVIYNAERVIRGLKESAQASGSWRKRKDEFHWVERAEAWDRAEHDRYEAELTARKAAIEAEWSEKVMGPEEVKGRLSEQGRVNIGDFVKVIQIPIIAGGQALRDKDGDYMMRETWDIDLDMVKKHGHLVKSISATQHGPRIELHDGQSAIVHVGKHHKLFTDRTELTGPNGEPIQVTDERYNRAVSSLADALRDILPAKSAETPGIMDAGEQPAVEGVSQPGG